jgi:signal transduction histidine kinase
MFKLLRYYSVTSLVAILATAILLGWFYRQVATQGMVQQAERNNLTLARTVLNSVRPELIDYLCSVAAFDTDNIGRRAALPELAAAIRLLMHNNSVVRIKLYNRRGVVAFSTKTTQIGADQGNNPGFISALNGGVTSALIYRDAFHGFDDATKKNSLIETYIPVRGSPAEPVLGVFEIYTDANNLVRQNEQTGFIVMAGAPLVLMALYATLLLVVRRARNIIESQHQTLRERSETLETLSSQMMESEESHKKNIAFELHEGLAQTLAAAKWQAESDQSNHMAGDAAAASARSIVPVLQAAIEEVRTIAMDMRPPSLDDLGLLPTIDWLCREFERQHPGIRIERQIPALEGDIPSSLKIVLYRIIVSVLDDMAQQPNTEWIYLALWLDDDILILQIDDTATEALDKTAIPLAHINPQLRAGFARMEELTTLSGGAFTASHHSAGGTMLRATWKLNPDVS